MNTQQIPPVESADFYVNLAFKRASDKAAPLRLSTQEKKEKSKTIELAKLRTVRDVLVETLEKIPQAFPHIDGLSLFYQELIKNSLPLDELKKALATVSWSARRVDQFATTYQQRLKRCRDPRMLMVIAREYYGRVASCVKQIKHELVFLEETRRILKGFPDIKEEFTVCIAGFPNVGKSTLLNKLTGAKAEVKAYAFTTKRLNVASMREGPYTIQLVDTPGTLNRIEKMNAIEKQAYLAMKYCAHALIYVYDLTEPYPLKDQEKLLKRLRELKKPVIQYLSKTDILEPETIVGFRGNKKILTDEDTVKKELIRACQKRNENR